jgi:hypothetical protein
MIRKISLFFGLGISVLTASAVASEPYTKNLDALIDHTRSNPATKGGSWLELQNAFGEWEKVGLIFGFADPGDQAACNRLRAAAEHLNTEFRYRCNPVD